jgi:hypothetical protein
MAKSEGTNTTKAKGRIDRADAPYKEAQASLKGKSTAPSGPKSPQPTWWIRRVKHYQKPGTQGKTNSLSFLTSDSRVISIFRSIRG